MVKRALLIGCNYVAFPQIQLYGCINDIVNMRNVLIDAYGYQNSNIYMLRDDDASKLPNKMNIMNIMSQLIRMSTNSDTLWIHYSGHGTQIRDTNGDESDSFDECIVPCDYNISGVITDDELFSILKNAKCQIMICFDSCNSGTGCDLVYSTNFNNGVLTKSINNISRLIANPNITMLSGCRDPQTSADVYDNNSKKNVGAFTQTLLETLRAYNHNVDILQLYSSLCDKLKLYGFTQIPVLSSSSPNPNFQFIRINQNDKSSNTNSVTTTATKTKDFNIFQKTIYANKSSGSLSKLMGNLIHK